MKKLFQKYLAILSAIIMLAIPLAVPAGVLAAPTDAASSKAICEGSGGTWDAGANSCGVAHAKSFTENLRAITNLLLFVIGAIAVVMIIIGAIRYVTSSGDQAQVTAAKNTIMYAIIGIVVAFLAYAIVNFVTGALK